MIRAITASSLLLLGLLAAAGVQAEEMTDRFIVRMKDSQLKQVSSRTEQVRQALTAASRAGVQVTHWRRMGLGAEVVRLPRAVPLSEARRLASLIATQPGVEWASVSQRRYPAAAPNDTEFSRQYTLDELTTLLHSASEATDIVNTYGLVGHLWYLEPTHTSGDLSVLALTTNWLPAWERTAGFTNASYQSVVAIIDTGLLPHADIATARVLPGYDFIHDLPTARDGNGRDSNPVDTGDWSSGAECESSSSSWHGTFVAGIIGATANNSSGIAGINPAARIVPVRVLGQCGGYDEDIIDGTLWAAGAGLQNAVLGGNTVNANPARVINLSLGGAGDCTPAYVAMVNAVRAAGSVLVVAAGNDRLNASGFAPANCPGVVAVSSNSRAGYLADYSNYGHVVALSAPGGGSTFKVVSTSNAGLQGPGAESYATERGTSFSTPMVAGALSLIRAVAPQLSVEQAILLVQQTASPFPADSDCTVLLCGSGVLDVDNALRVAASAVVADKAVYAFGTGSVTGRDIILQNVGNAAVTLGVPTVSSLSGAAGDFALTNSCGVSLGVAASCSIHVSFTSTTAGARYAQLVVPAGNGELRLPLYATQSGTVLQGPGVVPAFSAMVGGSSTRALTFLNLSGGTLSFGLDALSVPQAFAVDQVTCDSVPVASIEECLLPAGKSLVVQLSFVPLLPGTFAGNLVVTPVEGDAVTVPVSGNGTGSGGGGTAGFSGTGGGCTVGNGPADVSLLLLPALAVVLRRRRR